MKKKITTIFFVLTILLTIISSTSIATINPDSYKPSGPNGSEVSKITGIANPIIGIIKTVGIVVAVVTVLILGIKYMIGSIDEKAEYKKKLVPYLIGAIMVVAITQLIGVIAEAMSTINA